MEKRTKEEDIKSGRREKVRDSVGSKRPVSMSVSVLVFLGASRSGGGGFLGERE